MLLDSELAEEILEILPHGNDVLEHALARIEVRSIGPVLRLLTGHHRASEVLPPALKRNERVDAATQAIRGVSSRDTSLSPRPWCVIRLSTGGGAEDPLWGAYLLRLRRSAEQAGVTKRVSFAAAQATVELAENVLEHSELPESGIAYFDAQNERFEIGMIDTGIGMLQSLRSSPSFSKLPDDLAALREGVKDGVSRFSGVGRGFGFRAVIRVLQNSGGVARLRSGAAFLELIPAGSAGYEHIGGQAPICQGLWVAAELPTR